MERGRLLRATGRKFGYGMAVEWIGILVLRVAQLIAIRTPPLGCPKAAVRESHSFRHSGRNWHLASVLNARRVPESGVANECNHECLTEQKDAFHWRSRINVFGFRATAPPNGSYAFQSHDECAVPSKGQLRSGGLRKNCTEVGLRHRNGSGEYTKVAGVQIRRIPVAG